MSEEYLTFDETVTKLGVSEDELLNMVSSNTLRAFRIDRETKFKLEDVEAVSGSSYSSGNIDAPSADSDIELAEAPEDEVLELDDMPEDVVMLEEGDSADDLPPEQASESVVELGGESEEVMDFSDDSFEILEDEPTSEPEILEAADESLAILDSATDIDSNPELEETVITDSSSIENTEELSIDDDGFDFSTEEITVQEDAISEDELAAEQTVMDEDEGVDEGAYDDYQEDDDYPSTRTTARGSARRRRDGYDKPVKFKTDVLWTAVLAALVIIMIYPAMMMASLLFYGFTTGPSHLSVGKQTYEGEIKNISPVFVPGIFKWVQGKQVSELLGTPTFGDGHTGNIPFSKRLQSGMIKLDEDKPEEKSTGGK